MPSTLTNSPRSAFTPRKEFVKDQQNAPNAFCLLAVSGQNCIRLYSFPAPIIAVFRKFFDHYKVLNGFREDVPNNFCEFSLEGKPWASPKSVATERLLVELLSLVIQSGYTYLSTIDYGREHDDRLAIAFSRPASSRPDSPPSDGLNSLFSGSPSRLPFALSFPSATLLRVIAPPLDSTPAILQAVRGAWPRGVVSEKKVGDSAYEFKLKGYSWFQEDTFATDSLRHILTLLSRLDAHSFTLLTSVSLTNRSRVKDLWIFVGPPTSENRFSYSDSPPNSVLNSTQDFRRIPEQATSLSPPAGSSHHRNPTDPLPSPPPVHPTLAGHYNHQRSVSVDKQQRAAAFADVKQQVPPSDSRSTGSTSPVPAHGAVLRKPAPRAQVPVSVHEDGPESPRTPLPEMRANIPSHISEGLENMTGIGSGPYGHGHHAAQTPDVFYTTSPFGVGPSSPGGPQSGQHPVPPAIQIMATPDADEGYENEGNERWKTQPPAEIELPEHHPAFQLVALNASSSSSSGPGTPDTPKEIMGANIFRDSAFSSSDTEMSTEVPIKWTGTPRIEEDAFEPPEPSPMLPGGWQGTPIEEKREEEHNRQPLERQESDERELQDVNVSHPEVMVNEDSRKSQAGHIEMMAATVEPEHVPDVPKLPPSAAPVQTPPLSAASVQTPTSPSVQTPSSAQGTGWVFVNVEGQSGSQLSAPANNPSGSRESLRAGSSRAVSFSDGVDQGKGKSKNPSRIRRLFSLSRKDSKKGSFSDLAPQTKSTTGKLTRAD